MVDGQHKTKFNGSFRDIFVSECFGYFFLTWCVYVCVHAHVFYTFSFSLFALFYSGLFIFICLFVERGGGEGVELDRWEVEGFGRKQQGKHDQNMLYEKYIFNLKNSTS